MPYIYEDIDIKIAKISFGFNNKELLSLLTERGSIITSGELEKIPKSTSSVRRRGKRKKRRLMRVQVMAKPTFREDKLSLPKLIRHCWVTKSLLSRLRSPVKSCGIIGM